MSNLREFLESLDRLGELERVEKEVSTRYEIASLLRDSENALIFEKVNRGKMKVVGNIYGSRKRIALGLGIEQDELINRLRRALASSRKPRIRSSGPVMEVIEEEVDLEKLPILKHFGKDGGPYVTSSVLVAKDSDGNRNLSFHRMMLIGKRKFAVRIVPRNLYEIFAEAEDRGESLEVAAIIGVSPAVAMAAASSPPYEMDEYGIANDLSKSLELVKCHSLDLGVPAGAEMVLEGKLLVGERAEEGPFADITRTYDAVRKQPVFEVENIMRREDAIYQALLPGSREHQYLMGIPREPLIFEEIDKVVDVRNVILTPGGCGWLHGAVSIRKKGSNDARRAVEAAFRGHPSMKHVVVVDEDIDIYDHQSLEWAIATRFRADEDAVIKPDVEGSSLDPVADPETRLGCKMGIDATKDMGNDERFKIAEIPDPEEEGA